MGCSHCMINATLNNQDFMTKETFRQAVAFSKEYDLSFVLISGGEPLEHPEFFDFVQIAKDESMTIITFSRPKRTICVNTWRTHFLYAA